MLNNQYIFFRDDDVSKLDRNFINLFNLFLRNKIPVVYGVIPGRADDKILRFFLDKKDKNPSLIDIAQHGWLHKNYNSGSIREKYEFGAKRSHQEQKKDIIQGWLKLYSIFKDKFAPIFIPPYHAYDPKTLKVINELGERGNLKVFSAGQKTIPKNKNFLDIPAEIRFTPPKTNRKEYLDILFNKISDKLKTISIIGILLHHENYTQDDLLFLNKIINALKENKRLKVVLLSELIKNTKIIKLDITIGITNDCNLKCKICNIWKEKPKRYLLLKDIKKIICTLSENYSIGSVSLTGGEPFLNPEINEIYKFLAELKLNNKIDSIGIYTNGYAGELILNFLKDNSSRIEALDLGISVDGLEKNHNLLRGRPDSFRKIIYLIDKVQSDYPQVKLAVKFTISTINFKDLLSIYRLCREKEIFLIAKFMEFNSQFYYHRLKSPLSFNKSFSSKNNRILKNILLNIYKQELHSDRRIVDLSIMKALINFTDKGDISVKECYTPMYSLFINPNGDIHPCLYMPPVVNLKNKHWVNNLMRPSHLNAIEQGINNTCPKCFAFHGSLKSFNI